MNKENAIKIFEQKQRNEVSEKIGQLKNNNNPSFSLEPSKLLTLNS